MQQGTLLNESIPSRVEVMFADAKGVNTSFAA